ncbi:hypothetical protein HZY91_10700 [Facklamia sp. DSM 111018]|uniref:CopG family transcriptional regulator n=1 Tax=Facklamia lactis TaxID=2749967 RepID=A0ABS0LVL2_9LACT|nr:DUF5388 domain-containing protein [Facklamia lactis]MBG9987334.1 hypothetical protein [Facklamia lactis]
MGMVQKNKKLRKDNPIFDNLINRPDTNISKILSNSSVGQLSNNPTDYQVSATERVTIKVSNHTRNQIMSLANIGKFDNQKNAVETLVNEYVSKLSDDELRRYLTIFHSLELKELTRQNILFIKYAGKF